MKYIYLFSSNIQIYGYIFFKPIIYEINMFFVIIERENNKKIENKRWKAKISFILFYESFKYE